MTLVTRMAAKTIKEKQRRKRLTPAHALKASLRQAAAQKRLTVGLNSCVSKLKRDSESVMYCLLLQGPTPGEGQQAPDRAACDIQHTLLQAFCTENHIRLVRVMADAALMRLVRQLAGRARKEQELESGVSQEGPVDCSLLMIQHPVGPPSQEDKRWTAACQGGQLDISTTGHLPSD